MLKLLIDNDIDEKQLLDRIESLRKILIEIGIQKGLNSNEALEIGQILDVFIIEYQKRTHRK
ncbi:Spo0E family sporulation regulatory protein-aspartic acid phosphatase [Bacillus songklensis]|uniref:Spo0E family sporulation regulatory protein-aspartic acid phosphatase n=1 Tax=Bacillus songklensis TaxID=1069116 RepID=A0ABV8B0L7_9BACI